MKRNVFTSFGLLCYGLVAAVAAASSTPAVNVIILLVDDLGSADVSFSSRRLNQGIAAIETPALDSLAEGAGGIQLTKSYTHMICGPSRAALITGRLSHSLGNPFPMVKGGSLPQGVGTIAHEFKARGYSTHFVGKWGIDYPKPSEEVLKGGTTYRNFNGREDGFGPEARGFDTFYGLYGSGHNHYSKEVVCDGCVDWHKHNKTHKLDFPDVDHEPHMYSTHLFTREAINVMKSWTSDTPGFLHLSYTAPHDPLQAPDSYLNMPNCASMENWRRRTFCGMVKAVDEGISEIMAALGDLGLADNSIIFFSTDNGGAPSVGGFNYPYKGEKTSIYEGGIHNPAFINVPPKLNAVVRSGHYENVIHLADIAPTLLGIADRLAGRTNASWGIMGADIDGLDHSEFMLSHVAGSTFDVEGKPAPRRRTVLEFNALQGHSAYLEGAWKLVLGNAGRDVLFQEPSGAFFDDEGRIRYVAEQIICDLVDWLGPNYFVYGWVIRVLLDAAMPRDDNDGSAAETLKYLRNTNFGDGITIVEGVLPRPDWSKYKWNKVQLYNLLDDPHETRNVAKDNVELVEGMANRLRALVEHDPPHQLSVQKQFVIFAGDVVKGVIVTLTAFLILLVVVLRRGARTLASLCLFFGCAYAMAVTLSVSLVRVGLLCAAVTMYQVFFASERKEPKDKQL